MFVYRIFTYTWIWLNGCQLYFQTGHLHFFASLMWTGNKGSNRSNNNSRSTLDLFVVIGQAWGIVKPIVSKWGNIQRHFDGPLVNWVSWSLFRWLLSDVWIPRKVKNSHVVPYWILQALHNYVHVVMRINILLVFDIDMLWETTKPYYCPSSQWCGRNRKQHFTFPLRCHQPPSSLSRLQLGVV